MGRIARVVLPEQPHHIIQRGNRRQDVFFSDEDKKKYLEILFEEIIKADNGIEIWSYCLMNNHVHLIVVPKSEKILARVIGEAHRKYTRHINFREGWRGYLWQGRFSSYPLNKTHLYAAIRYVERNPVRAGIAKKAEEYRWSSAPAHVFNEENKYLTGNFVIEEIKDWKEYLSQIDEEKDIEQLRKHSSTGRPMGDNNFIGVVEKITGRVLKKKKPGRKKKGK